jgi:hypothetical protein
MRILVCGGRDFDDWGLLCKSLDSFRHAKNTFIQGGATGADFLVKVFAKYYKELVEEYPADWKTYGKAAGAIRNQQMLDEGKPDIIIAFPGGSGTADMVKRAKKAGLRVMEISYEQG